MTSKPGKLRIRYQIENPEYETDEQAELAFRYGLRHFETEGECVQCHEPITPMLCCRMCTRSKLCDIHRRKRYRCMKCYNWES